MSNVPSHPSATPLVYHNTGVTNIRQAAMTGRGNIWAIEVQNSNEDPVFLQIFDVAIGEVALGETIPDYSMRIAGTSVLINDRSVHPVRYMKTAATIAATTTRTGSTAPAAPVTVTIHYRPE